MRIARSVIVQAPREAVWERVGDPTRWPRDIGRMRCSHLGGAPLDGVGARYWLHLEVGAAEVGSLIEILEYEPESFMSWTTIRGFEQRGHWRLREKSDTSTELTLGVSYQASGGLAALVTDELSSIFVGRYLREALETLTRRLQGTGTSPQVAAPQRLLHRGRHALAGSTRAAGVIARARVARPVRPDRYLRSLAAIARSGPTTAARYDAAGALHPEAPALVDERGTLTFAQLRHRTNALASAFSSEGIGVGARVALLCRNHRDLVETILATCKLGADRLILDPALRKPELTELLRREPAPAIVYDAEFSRTLSGILRGRRGFIAWAEPGSAARRPTLEELIASADPAARAPVVGHDGRSTTVSAAANGTPTSVTHASPPIAALLSILAAIPLRSRERVLVAAPPSGRWGLAQLSLASMLASTLVLQRHFEAEATLAAIERERVGCLVLAPSMVEAMLDLPEELRGSYDTSSLRTVLVGDRPLPPGLVRRFTDEYGEILYSVYGTSATGLVTIAQPRDLRRAPGTAGRPPHGTVVSVLDEDRVRALPGETGRIFVAGDMLCDPGERERIEMFDGSMFSGDVGHLDDHGRLFVDEPFTAAQRSPR